MASIAVSIAIKYTSIDIVVFDCIPFPSKVVLLQAWSGPEGYRNVMFPDFMTTAQDGGKAVSLTHRPTLPPENAPGTHFC